MVQNIAVSGAVTQVLPNNLAEGNSASFSMTYTNGAQGVATGVFSALPTETGLTINSNSCGTASNRVTLPISGSCVVTATYTPPIGTSSLRSFTTTLSYGQGADVALTTSTMVQNIAVSGAVTQVLPNNLAEGNSASFSMTYTNGTQGIATGVFAALPTETGLTINSNSCGTASNRVTLPISGSCVVTATYTPPVDTSGLRSFTTTLSYGQGADVALTTSTMVQNIAVSGAVTQVLPNNLAEGNSASFSMTYTNGTQGVATGVFAALPTETGLTINSNSCGTASNRVTLPISGSCVVTATYTPPVDTSGLRSFTTTLSYGQGADVALTTSTMVVVLRAFMITNGTAVTQCTVDFATGAFSNCSDTGGTGFSDPKFIVLNAANTQAFIVNNAIDGVIRCSLDPVTGNFSACTNTGATALDDPISIALNAAGTQAFVVNGGNNTVSQCTVNPTTGAFSGCANTGATGIINPISIVLNAAGTQAFITDAGNVTNPALVQCTVDPSTGGFSACSATSILFRSPISIKLNGTGTRVFVVSNTDQLIFQCTVDPASGAISACADTGTSMPSSPSSIVFNAAGTRAFITQAILNTVTQCTVDPATGNFSACANTGATGLVLPSVITLN